LAARLRINVPSVAIPTPAAHTGGVVAVDAAGNVVCIMHSINTILWGATGLFVDGVSIPDSGRQRPVVMQAGHGGRIRETPTTLIVLEKGKPVLASASIGSSLYPIMLQSTISFLEFGMNPSAIVAEPMTHASPRPDRIVVHEGDFDASVIARLKELGNQVGVLPRAQRDRMWLGIQIAPANGMLQGATSLDLPSMVEGH
jgi:gamma-glutamyltranspeptidase/glutathione hydrolase